MKGKRSAASAAWTANMAESAPPLRATATCRAGAPPRGVMPVAASVSNTSDTGASRSTSPLLCGGSTRPAFKASVHFSESPVGHQAGKALLNQFFRRHAGNLTQGIRQGAVQLTRHHDRVAVGATNGFVHHAINQAQFLEPRGRDGQGFGRSRDRKSVVEG